MITFLTQRLESAFVDNFSLQIFCETRTRACCLSWREYKGIYAAGFRGDIVSFWGRRWRPGVCRTAGYYAAGPPSTQLPDSPERSGSQIRHVSNSPPVLPPGDADVSGSESCCRARVRRDLRRRPGQTPPAPLSDEYCMEAIGSVRGLRSVSARLQLGPSLSSPSTGAAAAENRQPTNDHFKGGGRFILGRTNSILAATDSVRRR